MQYCSVLPHVDCHKQNFAVSSKASLPAGDKCCIDGQPASFLKIRSPFSSSSPYAALANEQYRAPCCMMLRSTALRPLPVQNTQERIAERSVSDVFAILYLHQRRDYLLAVLIEELKLALL
jgi:hypothetical protein